MKELNVHVHVCVHSHKCEYFSIFQLLSLSLSLHDCDYECWLLKIIMPFLTFFLLHTVEIITESKPLASIYEKRRG